MVGRGTEYRNIFMYKKFQLFLFQKIRKFVTPLYYDITQN